jgi:hypothetical protein
MPYQHPNRSLLNTPLLVLIHRNATIHILTLVLVVNHWCPNSSLDTPSPVTAICPLTWTPITLVHHGRIFQMPRLLHMVMRATTQDKIMMWTLTVLIWTTQMLESIMCRWTMAMMVIVGRQTRMLMLIMWG